MPKSSKMSKSENLLLKLENIMLFPPSFPLSTYIEQLPRSKPVSKKNPHTPHCQHTAILILGFFFFCLHLGAANPSRLFLRPPPPMTDKARCCVLSGFCLQAQPGWCCPSHGQDWEPRKALLWWPGRVGCSASQAAVCTEPWEPGCWDWQQHRWQKAPLLFPSRCKRCREPYCQRGSLAWGPPRGYDAGNT